MGPPSESPNPTWHPQRRTAVKPWVREENWILWLEHHLILAMLLKNWVSFLIKNNTPLHSFLVPSGSDSCTPPSPCTGTKSGTPHSGWKTSWPRFGAARLRPYARLKFSCLCRYVSLSIIVRLCDSASATVSVWAGILMISSHPLWASTSLLQPTG